MSFLDHLRHHLPFDSDESGDGPPAGTPPDRSPPDNRRPPDQGGYQPAAETDASVEELQARAEDLEAERDELQEKLERMDDADERAGHLEAELHDVKQDLEELAAEKDRLTDALQQAYSEDSQPVEEQAPMPNARALYGRNVISPNGWVHGEFRTLDWEGHQVVLWAEHPDLGYQKVGPADSVGQLFHDPHGVSNQNRAIVVKFDQNNNPLDIPSISTHQDRLKKLRGERRKNSELAQERDQAIRERDELEAKLHKQTARLADASMKAKQEPDKDALLMRKDREIEEYKEVIMNLSLKNSFLEDNANRHIARKDQIRSAERERVSTTGDLELRSEDAREFLEQVGLVKQTADDELDEPSQSQRLLEEDLSMADPPQGEKPGQVASENPREGSQ